MKSALILFFCIICFSCKSEEKERIQQSLDEFKTALVSGNFDSIINLSTQETKQYFINLYNLIHARKELIEQNYVGRIKDRLLANIGADLVGNIEDINEFILSLISRENLFRKDLLDKLVVERISVSGNRGAVYFPSGYSIVFEKEADGRWKTDFLLREFTKMPAVQTLNDNLMVIEENITKFNAMKPPVPANNK
jgi:hypothetical protein